MHKPLRILFVCMGNICRSPAAEAILTKLSEKEGLSGQLEVDSCGTIGYHSGHPADARMRQVAAVRGYRIDSKARQFEESDFVRFDWIVAMDSANYQDLIALSGHEENRNKLVLFSQFLDTHPMDVPDPYYGGPKGFDHVLDLLEKGCRRILKRVSDGL